MGLKLTLNVILRLITRFRILGKAFISEFTGGICKVSFAID